MIKARKEIEGLVPYSLASKDRFEFLCLDLNENLIGPSTKIKQILESIDPNFLSQYPNYSILNRVIEEEFKVQSSQFVLTNGLDDGVMIICKTFLNQGEKVLIPTPTFSMYGRYAKISGANIEEVSFKQDFDFPYLQLRDKLDTGIKIMFICSPNNPTGTVIDPDKVINWIENFPTTLFVIDEAYVEFQDFSLLEGIHEFPNLLVLRTMSKAYGLAGLRVGLIFGNSELISYLKVVNPPFAVNNLATKILPVALADTQSVQDYVKTVTQNREWLGNELEKRGLTIFASQANFLLVKFDRINQFIVNSLKTNGILIRNQDHNSETIGWSRITIGSRNMLQSFLEILDQILDAPILLFDMDGVLIDVDNSYVKAIKQTVKYFSGEECSEEEIRSTKRIPGYNNDWDVTAKLLENREIDVPRQKIIDRFQLIYLGKNFDGTILNEKLMIDPNLLERLYKDYRLGIVTGRPKEEAEFTLNYFKIRKYFSSLITLDEVSLKFDKPNPLGIEMALDQMKGSTGYYFGDTINDILAAQRANLLPIGVTNENPKQLRENGAKEIISSINMLEDIL